MTFHEEHRIVPVFHRYLWNAYSVPGTLLSTGKKVEDKIHVLEETMADIVEDKKPINKMYCEMPSQKRGVCTVYNRGPDTKSRVRIRGFQEFFFLSHVYLFPTAAIANHHRVGGLKQQKFILSQAEI